METRYYLREITVSSHSNRQQLSVMVINQDKSSLLSLEWSGEASPDPVAALKLLVSSFTEGIVTIDEDTSQIQRQDSSTSPATHNDNDNDNDNEALLFDGGLNAFYSLHKRFDEITSLVFLNGLYGDEDQSKNIGHSIKSELQRARYQSGEIRKNLIQLDLNLSEVLHELNITTISNPGLLYAGIRGVLGGNIATLVVPLDYKAGTDSESLPDHNHDGIKLDFCELPPPEAQRAIATDSQLMNALRVCWEVANRTYNCGRCKRCTRAIPARRLVESMKRREASTITSRHQILGPVS